MKAHPIQPVTKTRSIVVARRSQIATVVTSALLGLALIAAGPSAAGVAAQSEGPPQAAAAKKKHKKSKKKRKGKKKPRPATGTPTVPSAPIDPADPGACAGEDDAEPDDNPFAATELPYPGSYATAHQRFLCPGDPDFFVVTVPADGYFAVSVQLGGGLDVALGAQGEIPSQTVNANGPGVGEYLGINNEDSLTSATVWIEVSSGGAPPSDTGSYALVGYET